MVLRVVIHRRIIPLFLCDENCDMLQDVRIISKNKINKPSKPGTIVLSDLCRNTLVWCSKDSTLMSFGESCGGRDCRSCVVRCSLVCWDAPARMTTTTCHGYDMGEEEEVVGLKWTKGMTTAFWEGRVRMVVVVIDSVDVLFNEVIMDSILFGNQGTRGERWWHLSFLCAYGGYFGVGAEQGIS